MKSIILLVSCLLVGTLAKPTTETEVFPNIIEHLPTVLRDLPSDISNITAIIPQFLSGEVSVERIREGIEKFLNQINPLSQILDKIPVVSTIYNFAINIASLPLTIIANVISLLLNVARRIVPGFSIAQGI